LGGAVLSKKEIVLISLSHSLLEIGLRGMSAFLKKEGFNTKIIFLKYRFEASIDESVISQIVNLSKDSLFIGISLMTNYFPLAKDLTQSLKKVSDKSIVWGGIHPTLAPEECIPYADIVNIGEGEYPLLELANNLVNESDITNIPNFWVKKNSTIIRNKPGRLITNLDLLPYPDYDLENHYIRVGNSLRSLREKGLFKKNYGRTYSLVAHRGCPFKCTFCANQALSEVFPDQKSFRKRSVENVLNEMVQAKERMGFLNYMGIISDDFFAFNSKEIKEFSENYKKSIRLPLGVLASPVNITHEKTQMLVEAGMNYVEIGVQSGSTKTMKLYKRHSNSKLILRAANILNSFKGKLSVLYDFILDNPWETDEDYIETINLVSELPRPFKLVLYTLILQPGTELYKKAEKEGILSKDENYQKYVYDAQSTYFSSILLLLNFVPLPKRVVSFLIDRKVRSHNLFFILKYFLLSINLCLKPVYFFYYFFKAISKADIGLLKNYIEVAKYYIRAKLDSLLHRKN
jgi:anaerobic magnesium-protoporphyrin IX monomethyl ester cyclase